MKQQATGALPSVASQDLQQAPTVKPIPNRFEKVGRSCKGHALEPSTSGRTEEKSVRSNQSLGQFNPSFSSTLVVSSQKTSAYGGNGVVAMPFDIDIEKKGRKRPSRKSRRMLDTTVSGGATGAIFRGDASNGAFQRVSPESSSCSRTSRSFRPNPSFRIKQPSVIPPCTTSTSGGSNVTYTKPDVGTKTEAYHTQTSTTTFSAEATGRLQYVPVAKLRSKLKQVSAITVSKSEDFGKLLKITDPCCSLKAAQDDDSAFKGQDQAAQSRSSTEASVVIASREGKSEKGFLPSGRADSQEFFFSRPWSSEKVKAGLLAGQIFRAAFRVNPFNRTEAYVTVEGVPVDIRIDGLAAQNRAVEGDVVAVEVDHPAYWAKLKTSNPKHFQTQIGNLEVASNLGSESAQISTADGASEIGVVEFNKMKGREAPGWSSVPNTQPQTSLRNSSVLEDELEVYARQEEVKASIADLDTANASVQGLAALVMSSAGRRPVGRVVAILEKSFRRETSVGSLDLHPLSHRLVTSMDGFKDRYLEGNEATQKSLCSQLYPNSLLFTPLDSRFPKMVVLSSSLPPEVLQRWQDGDTTLEHELFAARIESWKADSLIPRAVVKQSLGHGGKIKTQTAAILVENSIHGMDFPSAAMECLPSVPWKIPNKEIKRRRDLRETCVFSIDPPSAKDLDDALSIKLLDNGLLRVGVHIADVSYFVKSSSPLDKEAQSRSTSVYLTQLVLPMLPAILCEELCSLNPGVDRLAFSVIWDVDQSGEVVDQWMGRTVIRSCAKLTYADAQAIISGNVTGERGLENLPELHGNFSWQEVISDVLNLSKLAKVRRRSRFDAGALRLENPKLEFVLDAEGVPFKSRVYEHQDSNYLVEEFMLLANMSVAKVISKAFPDSALLRRHPEPNLQKLQELQEICQKSGFNLDISSSGALHVSLEGIRENVKDDPTLYSIIMLHATKPMQLAKYFSTGELKDKEGEWAHYALAVPFYTHFTSPIRRYPDLVVHRTLAAVLDAEEILSRAVPLLPTDSNHTNRPGPIGLGLFTGPFADKEAGFSADARTALDLAALKCRIPRSSELALVASHCNERKLACRNVADACTRLYLWAMLKNKQGENSLSEGRVVAVGPRFVSVYISGIAMEKRIYYEETDGLSVEWFESTGTVVLDISPQRISQKKQNSCRSRISRTIADVATLVNPTDAGETRPEGYDEVVVELEEILAGRMRSFKDSNTSCEDKEYTGNGAPVEPSVLPLTLKLFSTVPVSLHPTGGNNKPVDIIPKLYLSSYQTVGGLTQSH